MPIWTHSDDEVEALYEEISEAIHTSETYFTVVMGDFNAKVGARNGDELRVGPFGYGQRNHRGQRLVDFMEKEELHLMNSYFQKRPSRRWTWMSPDGTTRNEIDFIMTTKKRIFSDVSVIAKVKTGSDHRIVRGTLNINVKLERSRLVKSTLRPGPAHIQNPEHFQLELHNRFQCLTECETVDEINDGLVETVQAVGSKFYKTPRRNKPQKLSNGTIKLMQDRTEMRLQSSADMSEYGKLNRRISKSMRRDLRAYSAARIKEAIERNQGSKVFAKNSSIGQSQMTRLKINDGSIISTKPEILRELERFYGQLYTSTRQPSVGTARDARA